MRSKLYLFFDAERTDIYVNEYQNSLGEPVDISTYGWQSNNPELVTSQTALGGGTLTGIQLFDFRPNQVDHASLVHLYGFLCII